MHPDLVTKLLRNHDYVTSDFDMLNVFRDLFVGLDDVDGLAHFQQVPLEEAREVLESKRQPDLAWLAFVRGFMPAAEPGAWRNLPMNEEPYDTGPYFRWSDRMINYVRVVMSHPHGPSARYLAWRMDTTESRLKGMMRRNRIPMLPARDSNEPDSVNALMHPIYARVRQTALFGYPVVIQPLSDGHRTP